MKTLKLRVTGLCAGNSPVTGEFPVQMASNAENVSIDDVILHWQYSILNFCLAAGDKCTKTMNKTWTPDTEYIAHKIYKTFKFHCNGNGNFVLAYYKVASRWYVCGFRKI